MAGNLFYLPGGLAMVRDIGGDKKFVTDADGCCCDSTFPPTTTTTTPQPTTTTAAPTTTTGVPATGCPSDAWKLANCPTTLYVYAATGDCDTISCDDTYTLTYSAGDGNWWYNGPGAGCRCNAELHCHEFVPGVSFSWYLSVAEWCGAYRLGYCSWTRPVYTGDCPMGTFSAYTDYICDGCSGSVTVYS